MYKFRIFRRKKRVYKRKAKTKKEIESYSHHKEIARELIKTKLNIYKTLYQSLGINLEWNRVAIRDTKTRWGSCSSKKNLNFNYRIVLLEEELQDYIIVHELCHLIELNHGANFWRLVEIVLSDHKERRQKLKKYMN